MMGSEMYSNMAKNHNSLIVDRGLALLKMIRLATIGAGGEGYMNFMGNEFGHPDWIDFPREGNNWSYQYARRQWSLVDSPFLRYHLLNDFDAALIHLIANENTLAKGPAVLMHIKHDDQVLCFGRGNLLFVINFSPTNSYENIRFPAPDGYYKSVLNTDSPLYGGLDRIKDDHQYETFGTGLLSVYLPARTAIVLMPSQVS
jgi:1,4-alpha-glucan branching enzyme